MKKILAFIFLGFITLNLNLFSMEQQQDLISTPASKKLNKTVLSKITAAAVGCAFFTSSAIMALNLLLNPKQSNAINIKYATVAPIAIIIELLTKPFFKNFSEKHITTLTMAISAILALRLGFYVHKKLSQSLNASKNNNPTI